MFRDAPKVVTRRYGNGQLHGPRQRHSEDERDRRRTDAARRGRSERLRRTCRRSSFAHDVAPILSKTGCNAGACHASQYGKGGFKLSVFGFAPDEDYRAMVREWSGRRIDRVEPHKSLMLLKPTLAVPHGGNRRLTAGSVEYETLRSWIANGLGRPDRQRSEGDGSCASSR